MKTQIKKLKSSKLFYNKWPYKVECIHPGASRLIHSGVDLCKEWCRTGNGLSFSQYGNKVTDKVQYLRFIESVESFINRKDEIQIRVEGSHFNLFCKDPVVLEEIDNSVYEWVKAIRGPTSQEELEFLLSNGHKKILCDALPYEKYKYRLYFKSKFPADKRSAFVTWADKYGDKLEISETSRRWLVSARHYAQDPFMYVEDDKMLSMAGMYLSGYVKKVEEFILRDSVLPP
jgi:hypothetical protein